VRRSGGPFCKDSKKNKNAGSGCSRRFALTRVSALFAADSTSSPSETLFVTILYPSTNAQQFAEHVENIRFLGIFASLGVMRPVGVFHSVAGSV
jgi:hypothetical protein